MGDVIVSVGASTVPLYAEAPPSQKQDTLLKSILQDRDITSETLKYQVGGLPFKFNKMFKYVENSPHLTIPYVWSNRAAKHVIPGTITPTGVVYGSRQNVEDTIESIVGEPVIVPEDVDLGPPTDEFIAKWYLQENQGYSVTTNIVSSYPDPLDAKWEVTLSAYAFRYSTDTYFEIEITYLITDTTPVSPDPSYTETKVFDITEFTLDSYIYMAQYYLVSAPGEILYWVYDVDDNTYPLLYAEDHNDAWETGNEEQVFVPPIPLRQFANTLSDAYEPDMYQAAKEAANILDIDFDVVTESLNENPDIADVYSASLAFQVDLADMSEAVSDYLWYHLKEMRDLLAVNRASYERDFLFGIQTTANLYGSSVWIKDSIYAGYNANSHTYSTYTVFQFIEETFKVGTMPSKREYYLSDTYTADPDGPYAGQTSNKKTFRYLIVRKQLTPTLYSELLTVDPFTRDNVNTPFGGDTVNHISFPPYGIYGGEKDTDVVRLPMRITALNKMHNSMDKAQVIQGATCIHVYGANIVKLKWYETGVFRGILIIVATFISVATLQPEIALIAAAATLATAALLTLALVIDILIFKLLVDYTVSFLVKEFGLDTAFTTIAVTLAAAAAGSGFNAAGLGTIPGVELLLSATLASLSSFSKEAVDVLQEQALESDYFLESVEDRQEEIDAASDLLSNNIEYLDLVQQSPININETPDQFFTRTIHTGNIGITSLDFIHDYVDESLRLPDTDIIFT